MGKGSSVRRAWALIAFSSLAAISVAAAAPVARVTAIQATAGDDSTRVEITLTRAVQYKLFTLESPARVVLDLRGAELGSGVSPGRPTGVLSGMRTGIQPHDTLRVVMDVRSTVRSAASLLAPSGGEGHRLVVDLGGSAGAAAPAQERTVVAKHAPVQNGRDVIVAVDAGHGGVDPGAIGQGGTQEKRVVLEISKEVVARINAEPGMRAMLTRESDQFVSLRERIARARRAKADLFLSIHADAIENKAVSGASVYVLSANGASSEAARWLAERENAADLKGGVSLTDKDNVLASVLLDLSQTANISASMKAAERVLESIDRVGVVRKPKVQQAGFVVLKSPDIPSMLVETAYISNRADERLLRNEKHQGKLADAIVGGVRAYFRENPPEGTRFAEVRRLADRGAP